MHTPVRIEMVPGLSSSNIVVENLPVVPTGISVQSPDVIVQADNGISIQTDVILKFVYLLGVIIAFVLFARKIISILIIISNSKVIKKEGYRLVITDQEIPSFAFARSVIISEKDYGAYGSSILPHEKAHIRFNHFYDLMVLELMKTFHWFNPAVYGIVRNMKEAHEYQADAYTLNSGVDINQYQLLLIKKSVGSKRFALANSFNHCQIKKRITMINKTKNSKAWRWKVAIFLPMLAFLLMAFGKNSESVPEKTIVNEIFNQQTPAVFEITPAQQALTDQIIEIRSDGNYIGDKACTLNEITAQDKAWREASNKWILLVVDDSLPYARVDEVREALEGSYWVVQTTVGSDDFVYFMGDVSKMASLKEGDWGNWMKDQFLNNVPETDDGDVENFELSYSFIIDKSGKVRDAHVIRSSDPEIKTAVEEILAQIPDWNPAMRLGEPASVYNKISAGVTVVETTIDSEN